jgi:hypothetical protein
MGEVGTSLDSVASSIGVSSTTLILIGLGAVFVFGFMMRPKVDRVRRRTKSRVSASTPAWQTALISLATAGVGAGVVYFSMRRTA